MPRRRGRPLHYGRLVGSLGGCSSWGQGTTEKDEGRGVFSSSTYIRRALSIRLANYRPFVERNLKRVHKPRVQVSCKIRCLSLLTADSREQSYKVMPSLSSCKIYNHWQDLACAWKGHEIDQDRPGSTPLIEVSVSTDSFDIKSN